MTASLKLSIAGLLGAAIVTPLGLLALSLGVVVQAEAACTVPSVATSSTSAMSTPSAVVPADAAFSPPATAAAAAGGCDGGDGLPDGGPGGIPDGFVFPSNAQQATAVAFALAQLGKPYQFGASGPNAYDCSGLVMKAWAAAGVNIPRTTAGQVSTGVGVPNLAAMQPGDLILIPGSDGTMAHPGHVGMYIGVDSSGRQWLVQAPHTGTVVKTSLVSSWSSEIAAIRQPITHG